MTRRDFRFSVDSPRPASAWTMVMLASASLWLTQQLDLWAICVNAGAIVLSLKRRTTPHAWQQSPVVLNLGMMAIVAGTVWVALRGAPSTIALAHFAATTQGLQLLDARPRRTEFLLVALALFQVVLAANLTDSVFFTPLLIGFLFATVWTLIVHTLRSEAIEAGVHREAHAALNPALFRTTMLACVVAVLIGMILFVALPRLRTSVLKGTASGVSVATAGFSEKVEFGELGRIRQDATVVLRVETLEGTAPTYAERFYRGLAFDRFDGTSWSIEPPHRALVPGSAEGGIGLGKTPETYDLVEQIVREPVAAGVIFALGDPRAVQGTIRRLERDTSGGYYASGQAEERVRYRVRSQRTTWGDRALAQDRARRPLRNGDRYLQLPQLSPAFLERARVIVQGLETDAARVRAIEQYLVERGRYSDTPPSPDPDDATPPVEHFVLGELAGHCEYFASAMVLLARATGIPARLVNGFAGGRENSVGGFIELTRSDAHAWVEVHYERAGWVRYDPTPAALRTGMPTALTLAERFRHAGSAFELWWYQRVVGFDRADQIGALRSAWIAWQSHRSRGKTRSRHATSGAHHTWVAGPMREVSVLLGTLVITGLGIAILWRGRQKPSEVPEAYAHALRLLKRRGFERGPSTTASDFVEQVRATNDDAAKPLARLTEAYLATRFGGMRDVPQSETLAELEHALTNRDLQRAP